jgi:hypothetical protein
MNTKELDKTQVIVYAANNFLPRLKKDKHILSLHASLYTEVILV